VLLVGLAGDRQEDVRVERVGDRWRVTVGDSVYDVDAVAVHGERDERVVSLLIGGAQHEVAVSPDPRQGYRVSVGSRSEPVEMIDPLVHAAREARGGSGRGGGGVVTAYMPGRVAAVLVEEGAEVAAGEGVVVLEAMKMENEIQAESDGTVTKIFVEAGQAVEGGDPLFEIG
jgi:biotin carboxyl carrier protein